MIARVVGSQLHGTFGRLPGGLPLPHRAERTGRVVRTDVNIGLEFDHSLGEPQDLGIVAQLQHRPRCLLEQRDGVEAGTQVRAEHLEGGPRPADVDHQACLLRGKLGVA